MAAKSIRKTVTFDDSDGDRSLLDAIATHQSEHEQSFSDLCKQALHQYLLSREPTQPILLFMEQQQQIAQLNIRVTALEKGTAPSPELSDTAESVDQDEPIESEPDVDDPVLNRLGPLLDDF